MPSWELSCPLMWTIMGITSDSSGKELVFCYRDLTRVKAGARILLQIGGKNNGKRDRPDTVCMFAIVIVYFLRHI